MSQTIDLLKRSQSIDQDWYFDYGLCDTLKTLSEKPGKRVDLPHDYMIAEDPSQDAVSGPAMGFFNGKVAHYTKFLTIPMEWKEEQVLIHFDGVMMNASVEVNGSLAGRHHYGYTPFDIDISSCIYWGEENRITVTINPSMQPNSRWYTGAGIYRHVTLIHRPLIHIATDGIYAYTRDMNSSYADIMNEVSIENGTLKDHLVEAEIQLSPETFEGRTIIRHTRVLVKSQDCSTARIPVTVTDPVLWDVDHPELYTVTARVKDMGVFGPSLDTKDSINVKDEEQILFGIRSLKANSTNGLRINGKEVKLKGGCIHHDNGILGAVSLYDSEYRKLKNMKDLGYNAVRLAHNPASADLLEACDRLGMYVFNEAFDAWGMSKQPGDYGQFFSEHWKEDMKSFMLRDRNHPSVIIWSTGNEIVERGGLGNGYKLAEDLAEYMRSIDSTRFISNALCSYWSGLDDKGTVAFYKPADSDTDHQDAVTQNASSKVVDTGWEERSEAFTAALDVVGYNYMDDHYGIAGSLYPERVIVGTESFPMSMEKVWNEVERLPYVIGDFTWTSYDYIGEAGIGKSVYTNADDPILKQGPFALMSFSSQYPWRLGNDADLDINGNLLPQGAMRKILWGGKETFLFTVNPQYFEKTELISPWGWPDMQANWNWSDAEGKMIHIVVYSGAPNVELFLNGESLGKASAGREHHYTAEFDITYHTGTLEAVSLEDDREVSRSILSTTGAPVAIRLVPEKKSMAAGQDNLCYVAVEVVDADGKLVPDAAVLCNAIVSGAGSLAAFGSGNPKTDENYTSGLFTSYHGRLTAVLRAQDVPGEIELTVSNPSLGNATIRLETVG